MVSMALCQCIELRLRALTWLRTVGHPFVTVCAATGGMGFACNCVRWLPPAAQNKVSKFSW
jgi:hypothetical protein